MEPLKPLIDTLGAPLPVYVLVGAESLLVREAEERARKAVIAGGIAAFNDATLTAGEEAALSFADIARQSPMMAPRRLVVIRQMQEANAALLDALLAYVQAPSPTTTLLLVGEKMPAATGGVDRGTRIANAVKKTGLVLKLAGEGVDAVAFAVGRARDLGCRMESGAAQMMVGLVGDDLSLLASEVEKCAGYAGSGGVIDLKVVELMCAATAETEVWALTNALVARDRSKTLAALHRLLEDGEAPHKLLSNVTWQIRQLLTVQDMMARGLPERDAGLKMHPMALKSMREMLSRHRIDAVALLEQIAAANQRMNSSRVGDRRIFEGLVLQLTHQI